MAAPADVLPMTPLPGTPKWPPSTGSDITARQRGTTVRVALLAPPDAQHGRTDGAPPFGECADVGRGQAGDLAGSVEGPFARRDQELLGTLGVAVDELAVDALVGQPQVRHRVGERGVGAGADGQVEVGALRPSRCGADR